MLDEDPSPEDIERFNRSDEIGYCSACGAEVSELADVCPKCLEYLPDGPSRCPLIERQVERRWVILVVIVLVLALVGLLSL